MFTVAFATLKKDIALSGRCRFIRCQIIAVCYSVPFFLVTEVGTILMLKE